MKKHYDRNARFHGPYEISWKVSDLNYIVNTHNQRKTTQMCYAQILSQKGETEPCLNRN